MAPITPLNPALTTFLARHITNSATGPAPTVEDLAAAIQEITVETQTAGSSLLQVTLVDPGWLIQRNGFLDVDADGLLPAIEVNFPEGSDLWWRLAMVEASNDLNDANLTLTFQDRIVAYLHDHWGSKGVAPGTTTRAQFIKQLVDEVGRGGGVTPISFVCPALGVGVKPSRGGSPTSGTLTAQSAAAAQGAAAKVNKSRGLGAGAAITVKGQTPSMAQLDEINTLLSVAQQLNAGTAATEALVFAAIAESGVGADSGAFVPNSAGYYGVLQGSSKTWPDPRDTAGMATAFLRGGKGFQSGGAIALARGGQVDTPGGNTATQAGISDPIEIAVRVEVPSVWPVNAYAQEAGYSNFLPEAKKIVSQGGGSTASAGPGVLDASQLSRGTVDNPGEDSWECMQRLASDVNWSLFTVGGTLYYIDGPDLAAQKPALYLKLSSDGTQWSATDPATGTIVNNVITNMSAVFDNTAYQSAQTRKKKGKIQRATRIRKPQTPSQAKFNMICGVLDFAAGDVFVFQDSGVLTGRWIVEDTTRNAFADTFTQFTLGPPTAPLPDPATTPTGATPTGTPGSSASIANRETGLGVAQAAQVALGQKSMYSYSEGANRGNGGTLFGPAPRTMDCSAFATLCFKAAGLPDPNHQGYSPIGNTASLLSHCTKVSDPQPGDLVFYGPGPEPLHVTVYIGNGQVISMGKQGDPSQGAAGSMGPAPSIGTYRPDVIPTAKVGALTPGLVPNLKKPLALPSLFG